MKIIGVLALAYVCLPILADTNHVFQDWSPSGPAPVSRPATPVPEKVQEPADTPGTITTVSGKTYRFIRIQQAYPDALVISYIKWTGMRELESIKFSDLPVFFQRKYNYNPTNAAAYEMQAAKKLEALTPTPAETPDVLWHECAKAEERLGMELEQKRQEAIAESEALDTELKIRTVQAQEKEAEALMFQALQPDTINVLQKVNVNINHAPGSPF